MAITVKPIRNIARRNLTSNAVTIQPGAVATLFFPNSSLNNYVDFSWNLAIDNDSRVYSDLIITGSLGRITARNMSSTAFTGSIKINVNYYPYDSMVFP